MPIVPKNAIIRGVDYKMYVFVRVCVFCLCSFVAVLLCDIIKDLINWQILYLQSLLIITSAVSPMTLSLPPTIDA